MGRRLKAINLVLVSILVLMASVFPHHHHGERICLKNDIEQSCTTCSDKETAKEHARHSSSDAGNACKTNCITHLLQYDIVKGLSIDSGISLFTLVFILSDITYYFFSGTSSEYESQFIKQLLPQYFAAIRGLRAPPYILSGNLF